MPNRAGTGARQNGACVRAPRHTTLPPFSSSCPSSSSHRMQRDTIAFAVEHDGAGTVWADGMLRLEHLAAVRSDCRDSLVKPPLAIEVEQWPLLRRFSLMAFAARRQTSAHSMFVGVRQHGKAHALVLLLLHRRAKHRRVELDCPVEVLHRYVAPDELVAAAIGGLFERFDDAQRRALGILKHRNPSDRRHIKWWHHHLPAGLINLLSSRIHVGDRYIAKPMRRDLIHRPFHQAAQPLPLLLPDGVFHPGTGKLGGLPSEHRGVELLRASLVAGQQLVPAKLADCHRLFLLPPTTSPGAVHPSTVA